APGCLRPRVPSTLIFSTKRGGPKPVYPKPDQKSHKLRVKAQTARRSTKRVGNDRGDKPDRSEPTHSRDQQLRHTVGSRVVGDGRLIRGRVPKVPVSKKEPRASP